jgi:hypothetical protein
MSRSFFYFHGSSLRSGYALRHRNLRFFCHFDLRRNDVFPFSRLNTTTQARINEFSTTKLRYGMPILLLNEFSTANYADKRI